MPRGLSVSLKRLAAVLGIAALVGSAAAFEIEQLTCVPSSCRVFGGALLTGDGRRVLFRSTCDLDPGRNPDGVVQVFALDVARRSIQQLTPPRFDWALRLGYLCDFNMTSDHAGARVVIGTICWDPDLGMPNLFMRLLDYSGVPGQLDPLGPIVPCGMDPALSADGRHIAASSDCHPNRAVRGPRERFALRPKLYFEDGPGGRFRRLRVPRSRRCRVFAPVLSRDGQVAVFSSDCDLERGTNVEHGVQIFRLDRRTGKVRQVNPPERECNVAFEDPPPFVIMDDPALSADGQVVVFSAGPCGEGFGISEDAHLFRRRTGQEMEQLTFGFCVTQQHEGGELRGITLFYPPAAVSEDGRTIAFAVICDELPVFTDKIDRVFLYRDDPQPHVVEVFSHPSTLDAHLSEVSMDAAATTLALTAPGTLGPCPGSSANQVYVVRNLQEPTADPSTCACRAPAP